MGNDEDDSPSEPRPATFHTHFTATEPPSIAVSRSLAAIEGVEQTQLDPLAESVEPEALDNIFREPVVGGENAIVTEFTTSGHRVTVRDDGSILIRESERCE